MCLSPRKILQNVSAISNPSSIGMDRGKFHSSPFQRVYQYLWQHHANKDLDQFVYEEKYLKHDCATCLQMLIEYVIGCMHENQMYNTIYAIFRNCGVRDPSWSEINHFITFFDLQLKSCENSDFFIPNLIKDIMPGLKEFVVKFMIQMSRVYELAIL